MIQSSQCSETTVSTIFKLYHLGIAMLHKCDPPLQPCNIRKLPLIWLLVSCTHLHFYGQQAIPYLSPSSVFTSLQLQEACPKASQCVFTDWPKGIMKSSDDTALPQHPRGAVPETSTVSSSPDTMVSITCGTASVHTITAPSMSNCAQATPWPQPWHSRPQKISMLVSVYKAISNKKTTKAQLRHKRMTQIRPQVNPVLRATNRFLYAIYIRSNGLNFQYTWNFLQNALNAHCR